MRNEIRAVVACHELAGSDAAEVRDWEPAGALTDGADGLSCYRAILDGAPEVLAPGGRLVMVVQEAPREGDPRSFRAYHAPGNSYQQGWCY